MDTRVPHLPGREDFFSFVRFLDNRKEFEKYVKVLDEKVAKFVKATETYGKAKDIERLHREAETLALRAQGAFEDRENKLAAGEEAFQAEVAEKQQTLAKAENDMKVRLRDQGGVLHARDLAIQGREKSIAAREVAAQKMKEVAAATQKAAQEAKRAAEDMMVRMKAATVVETA